MRFSSLAGGDRDYSYPVSVMHCSIYSFWVALFLAPGRFLIHMLISILLNTQWYPLKILRFLSLDSSLLSSCCLVSLNFQLYLLFLRYTGLSLLWPLLLRSTGSGHAGSAAMAHGPSRSVARGILPDRGMNPRPLRRQADSQPLRHQGSPNGSFYNEIFTLTS